MTEPKKDARQVRFGDLKTPGGYRIDEVTSALQKDLRRGNEREALHWATELSLAGYTNYVWKRLRIIATEDVGLGEPMAAVLVRCLYENWLEQKKADKGSERHANLFLVHAVLALARATKSRMVDHAYVAMLGNRELIPVPDYALDMHTKEGRRRGRGIEHFYEEGAVVRPKARFADQFLEEAIVVDQHEEEQKQAKWRRPQGEPLFDDE